MVYASHTVDGEPLQRIFYELYRDKAAFEAHEAAPDTRRYLAERGQYLAATEVDWLTLQAGLARGGQRKSWWTDYGDQLPPGTGEYLDLEAAATRISTYSPQIIPGLAQTADYAAAVVQATRPDLTAAQVCGLASIQQRRQSMADRNPVARQHFVIDEAALLSPVGSARVMADQLACLVAATTDQAVTHQIIPMAAIRTVISPAFAVLSSADPADPDVACTVGSGGQITLARRDADVAAARTTFDLLTHLARSAVSSARLIEKTAMSWAEQAAHKG